MKSFRLNFNVEKMPFIVSDAATNGNKFLISGNNGVADVMLYYDFRIAPLHLTAPVMLKDNVSLRVFPHRIELVINGKVLDEEWPCGQLLFSTKDDNLFAPFPIDIRQDQEEFSFPNSILWSFLNAEGWRPDEYVFVGDCMPYVNKGRYHVLYLKDRHHHTSKWGFGAHQWEHISSADLLHWDVHPTAVAITQPEEGSICTGSWINCNKKEYLFYTVRMTDGSPAPICRSVSSDGYHFEKDTAFHFTLPEHYHGPSARDPKVVCAADGVYHMILTTSLIKEGRGCLAHLISDDLDHWEDVGPIYISDDETQPECPDYFELNGYYYLLFSLHAKAQYRFSSSPFRNWQIPDDDPHIPCASVPKGAVWNGKVIFTGFDNGDGKMYAGRMTFATAEQCENGELKFEEGIKCHE